MSPSTDIRDETHCDICVETGAEQKDEIFLPTRIFKILLIAAWFVPKSH
jgi:hypothetical protein